VLGRRADGPLVPLESMYHVAGDAVFLLNHGDGLFRVVGRRSLIAAFGVGGERPLELLGEAEDHPVRQRESSHGGTNSWRLGSQLHNQAAELVFEHPIHAADGLHEAVALHRLIGIYRVKAGRVETSRPHVAHDHDLERVLKVLKTGC